MPIKFRMSLFSLSVCLLTIAIQSSAFAQGHGHGQGGQGNSGMGRSAGMGEDRGMGVPTGRSNGRADSGRGNASDNSNGRSDAGLERARLQRENVERADRVLSDHPQMPARLHTTANSLRSGYQNALLTNPNLKFGQFVAATRLATNLGRTHPNITRAAILNGLANGRSLGQTLQDLGLGKREAEEAKKQVERDIKDAEK